jgi:hypothetical protein
MVIVAAEVELVEGLIHTGKEELVEQLDSLFNQNFVVAD